MKSNLSSLLRKSKSHREQANVGNATNKINEKNADLCFAATLACLKARHAAGKDPEYRSLFFIADAKAWVRGTFQNVPKKYQKDAQGAMLQ